MLIMQLLPLLSAGKGFAWGQTQNGGCLSTANAVNCPSPMEGQELGWSIVPVSSCQEVMGPILILVPWDFPTVFGGYCLDHWW